MKRIRFTPEADGFYGAYWECKVKSREAFIMTPGDFIWQGLMPAISGLVVKFAFSAAKAFPKECRQTRTDIDKKIRSSIEKWKASID